MSEIESAVPGISHLVAIASAKGGVGKSTVAVNLALALEAMGKKVGLVDADILGPSIPGMLGVPAGQLPQTFDGQIVPIERHGLKVISMGMLTSDDAPAILRGPMVSKYIQLFISGARWGELDYLIIDLPPGTGDTQLTLAQSIPLSGAVIVTTPQEVSLKIARRGLRMFERVRVPILGLVENMSGFACPHCGQETDIFRRGGGERMSEQLGVRLLGKVPIDAEVVLGGDSGKPIVLAKSDSPAARAYRSIAETVVAETERRARVILPAFDWSWNDPASAPGWRADAVDPKAGQPDVPVGIRRKDARTINVLWEDGVENDFDVRDLRLACRCAYCVEEMSGRALLDASKVPLDVIPIRIVSVGRYAVAVSWTDGHDSGIYAFDRLRALGDVGPHEQAIEV